MLYNRLYPAAINNRYQLEPSMSATENTPANKNFLSPLNFKFSIKRAPHVNFFLQKASIPMIQLPQIDIPNIFVPIPTTQTHLQYGRFSVTFKVDEDLENYMEIHNWMRALGFPDNFDEYKAIKKLPEYTGEGLRSDLSLIILNSTKTPNYEFVFRDAFPTFLSQVDFDSTLDDVNYVAATVEFTYTLYDINKL
jgi:hypothetical protein